MPPDLPRTRRSPDRILISSGTRFGASCRAGPLPAGRAVHHRHYHHRPARGPPGRRPNPPTRPRLESGHKATRPEVEWKIGHLMRRRHGGRRARVHGQLKVAADFALLAAAANVARLAVLGLACPGRTWAGVCQLARVPRPGTATRGAGKNGVIGTASVSTLLNSARRRGCVHEDRGADGHVAPGTSGAATGGAGGVAAGADRTGAQLGAGVGASLRRGRCLSAIGSPGVKTVPSVAPVRKRHPGRGFRQLARRRADRGMPGAS